MANAVNCRTFCNRLSRCYYYTEKDNYIKYISLFFIKLLKEYSLDTSRSFVKLFSDKFNSIAFTGIKFVYLLDRQDYANQCITSASNLDRFLAKHKLTEMSQEVVYKDKVRCFIGGKIDNKNINVHFCFKSMQEMNKELDFYLLNNYIYNLVKGVKRDCLIFNAQEDKHILVRYGEVDYTMKRGFLKTIITSKIRKQGEHCVTCKQTCKPMFINGLDRLTSII